VRRNTAVTAESASSAQLRTERDAAGALRLILSGRLDVDSTGALWREATLAARGAGRDALVVDASGLVYCDTAGAALLVAIEREQRAADGPFAIEGLRDEFEQVVAMLRPSVAVATA